MSNQFWEMYVMQILARRNSTLSRSRAHLRWHRVYLIALVGCLTTVAQAKDHSADVSYFAVVKNLVRQQDVDNRIQTLGHTFLAYVFLQPGAQASNATLSIPGAPEPVLLPDFRIKPEDVRDSAFFLASSNNADKTAYDIAYPNGTYTVAFTTRAGRAEGKVTLNGDMYPAAAVIALAQKGEARRADDLIPGEDLHVTWGGFPQGKPDRNGILDDLVFVILKDCNGKKLYHSGRPFQGRHLTFKDKSEVIRGQLLQPGRRYLLVVDNAIIVDTNRSAGVPGVGTYAQTTRLSAVTSGKAPSDAVCKQ
jgi:hypothetical protein